MATKGLSIRDILSDFLAVSADPYHSVSAWKAQNGKRVVGCFPMDIPEEIIHAAGMLPVVMWESDEAITVGHAHVSPYNCGLVRSVIDDGATGKLSFLDGLVCYETCLQAGHVDFILRHCAQLGYIQRITLPGVITFSGSRAFMVENLRRLVEGLEELGQREITGESLRQSIRIYNENRALLRKLYQLRRSNPGLLKASEVVAIVQSSQLMLKEDHNRLLSRLLNELGAGAPAPETKARVILSGSLCQAPRGFILDLIEDAGLVVVDDDLYTGSRYFANDVRVVDDPLGALADRYLERTPPSPTKVDSELDWGDYIAQMAAQNQARGVITFLVKYCPPHLAYYPDIERKLSSAGIGTLMLEMEHELSSLGQVKTRLQAFAEALETS